MKFFKGCLMVVGALFGLLILLAVIGTMMQSPEERAANEQKVEEIVKQEAAKEQAKKDATPTKKAETKKVEAPAPLISVTQILKDYDNNKLKAEQTYKGKRFRVKGVVTSIGSDILDKPYITIGTGDQFEIISLQCIFKKKDADKLAKLDKGQQLVVTGTVDDYIMNILMKDCEF